MESLVVGSLQEAEATAHETLKAQQRLRLDLAVQDPYQSHLEEVVLSLQSQLKNQEMGDDLLKEGRCFARQKRVLPINYFP